MRQLSPGREASKVLQHYPEIVELTEARKRAVAGGRASVETALKQMIADAKKPNDKVIDYDRSQATGTTVSESPSERSARLKQDAVNQARSAAYAAQNRSMKESIEELTQ